MVEWLAQYGVTTELLTRVAIFTIVLAAIWLGMRFVFRLTRRLFLFGCGSILVLAIVLVLMRVVER